ncbi:MAG: hypothetical protein ACU0CO_14490 [Shimia sp.]
MDNMQKSERVVASILGVLMERGLQQGLLEFAQLNLDAEYEPFFLQSLSWLEAEGLIRTTGIRSLLAGSGVATNPMITTEGMALLQSEVSMIDETPRKLAETVEEVRAGESTYAKAGNFTGGVLAAFLKSFG